MTDNQSAQHRMFQAIQGVFALHTTSYQRLPGLVMAHAELERLTKLIAPSAAGQQGIDGDTEGVSLVKKSTRQTLATRAADLASLLHSYADSSKNIALLTESDYTDKMLYRKSDADIVQISKRLHLLGVAEETALVAEGLEADELKNLDTSIKLFESEIGTPATIIAEGSSGRKARKALFKETMALFRNRLDKLMLRFKSRDLDFYNAYQTARQVINTAKRYEDPTPPAPNA